MTASNGSSSLSDEFLPAYDVSDAVAVLVEAETGLAWRALLDVDLVQVGRRSPLVGVLGAVRTLPEAVAHLQKFWPPVISYVEVEADGFREFNEPGFAKTVYTLSAQSQGAGKTLLSGTMRTATTDEHARRWFRHYWTFGVGFGAHVPVSALLEAAREQAEFQP